MKLTPREPTPEMLEAERIKFEEWAPVEGFNIDRCYDDANGLYHRVSTRWAWKAWIERAMHDAAPSGWQPIETAPRVFSPPLSFNSHYGPTILGLWGKSFYCVCRWGGTADPQWIDGMNRPILFQPTHWMPLPAPPKGE